MEKLITITLLSYKSRSKKKINIWLEKNHRKHVEKDATPFTYQSGKEFIFINIILMTVVGTAYGASYSFCRCIHMQAHNYLLQMCLIISWYQVWHAAGDFFPLSFVQATKVDWVSQIYWNTFINGKEEGWVGLTIIQPDY